MDDSAKLKQLISDGEKLASEKSTSDMPEFSVWHTNVERFLNRKYGDKSVELRRFKLRPFGQTARIVGVPNDDSIECVKDIKATILELKTYLGEESGDMDTSTGITNAFPLTNNKVFIVHGHDGEIKEAVARMLEKQGIEPIILNEQANQGKTIIEKFEKYSDTGAAIALFTNDDVGKEKDAGDVSPRARQNVVFEAGFFMGKLGRDKVIIIAEKENELPSDLEGVVYTDRDSWKIDVCRELKTMGYAIDFNKLIG